MSRQTAKQAEPISLTPWLARLNEQIEVARAGEDPEGVHQVRVAAGRLDVGLRIAGLRVLRDDLRWLRASASQVRDYDVLLARALPSSFAAWIERERAHARTAMLHTFDSPRCTALLGALALLGPLDPAQAAAYAKRELRKVEERGRALEGEDAGVEDMHYLRRAVRRLRYAREWLGGRARRVKALQDELGRLNDATVALAALDRFPHVEQMRELREQLGDEVREAFEDAQAAWRDADLERAGDDA
jgi:CHAD domain-containing protein